MMASCGQNIYVKTWTNWCPDQQAIVFNYCNRMLKYNITQNLFIDYLKITYQ